MDKLCSTYAIQTLLLSEQYLARVKKVAKTDATLWQRVSWRDDAIKVKRIAGPISTNFF